MRKIKSKMRAVTIQSPICFVLVANIENVEQYIDKSMYDGEMLITVSLGCFRSLQSRKAKALYYKQIGFE